MLCKSFEPVVDGGDAGGGPVSDGGPVVPGGQAAVVLEAAEAALDGVAVLVTSGSKAGGPPPAPPRRRRLAARSALTGIVARMWWARSQSRLALEEWALSARTRSGRVRGRPQAAAGH